jgi:predicted proteasome-type protease
MSNLSYISLVQTWVGLALFMVTYTAMSAIAGITNKKMLSFTMSGGCFLTVCFAGLLASMQEVIYAYLYRNGQKVTSNKPFKMFSRLLVILEIGLAIYFVATMYFS